MAIAVTGSPAGFDYGSAGFSQAITTAVGTTILIVFIGDGSVTERTITAMTHHGGALTQIPLFTKFDTSWTKVTGWYRLNPDIGTFDLNTTYGTSPDLVGMVFATFSGVDTTTPFGTAVVATALSGTTASVTASASAGDYLIGACMSDSNTSLTEDGTILAETIVINADSTLNAQYKTTTGSVTLNWTQSSASYAAGAVALKPTGGGGGSDTLWAQSCMGLGLVASLGALLRPLARQREAVARGRSFVQVPSGLFVPDWMAA